MLVGIHQLHYLPWLRYFEKIARADVFIALDNIQFNKNGWQNRNKIKAPSGAHLLSVPVHAGLGQTLDQIRIDTRKPWRKKHWRTLEQCYAKTPFFADHAAFLEAAYEREWDLLNSLNHYMLEYYLEYLGIETQIFFASDLDVPGIATERLINLIKAVGGTQYYSGAFALEVYLDADQLAEAGIELVLQHWKAPTYPQRYGDFVPDLSIIDLMMNYGPESLNLILGETP